MGWDIVGGDVDCGGWEGTNKVDRKDIEKKRWLV